MNQQPNKKVRSMKKYVSNATRQLHKIFFTACALTLMVSGIAFSADMDFNGIYRPQGNGVDIGACEYADEDYQAPPPAQIPAPTNLKVVASSNNN